MKTTPTLVADTKSELDQATVALNEASAKAQVAKDARITDLTTARAGFTSAIEEIDAELATLNPSAAPIAKKRGPKSKKNGATGKVSHREGGTLDEHVLKALKGRKTPMSSSDLIEAVLKGGYTTTSKPETFKAVVAASLNRLMQSKSVVRPARGTYTAA